MTRRLVLAVLLLALAPAIAAAQDDQIAPNDADNPMIRLQRERSMRNRLPPGVERDVPALRRRLRLPPAAVTANPAQPK